MILYMYIAPGQGQTAPRGKNFDVNRNISSLHSFVASLKKNVFAVWFYTIFFFTIEYMYIAPGQGQTALGDKILILISQKGLITLPIFCRF